LKLLVGTHYFDTHKGGVEVVAAELARALALDEGVEVTWLASDASPPPAEFPGRTLPVACWNLLERRVGIPLPLPSARAISVIHDAVAASDAVLLHDALYPTNAVMAASARRLSKPLVVVQHVGIVPYRNPLARGLMRAGNRTVAARVLESADRVVFISGITKAYFAPRVRFRHPPSLVFNGLRSDLPDLDSLAPRQEARRRLGLAMDRYTALFVGRFVEKKGLEVIARMARDLPDVQWVLCGWGPMDPSRWSAPNVRVLGAASGNTLADAYRAADTLVLPSVGEGLPLVVQEALAMGTSVVGSDDLLVADPWLRDRIVTAPVSHADIDSTAVAWCKVIKELSRSGGLASRPAEVRERYDWRSSARAYAVMLRELVAASEQKSGRDH
jgi:glycosyltransferase involved in cell wall biosynthesis